ncbi:hypothetical protein [Candidatus Jidaibacter acanthamoebae]|uniref:hypothetical protein n=1 Tax=Candidatus Jidaibacter acanthamoebae TaxID=86105 RepID=UPI0012699FA1|nr:hypothetical protein [Candidatus Jidaibacter acanthamoeba]
MRITPSYYISWDDFTHWGTAAKEIHLYKGLHTVSDLTSLYPIHFNYTRIPALFCYFITKSIGYTEGNNMFAMGLLCMLFSSTVLVRRSMLQSALLFFSVLAAAILYTPILRSLYIDGIVGIAFGAVIAIYMQENNKDKALLCLLPLLFLLPNIKEVGFWLAYAAAITISTHFVSNYKLKKHNIILLLFLFILPYISHKLWATYLLNFGIISPHSSFSLAKYAETLLNVFSSEQNKAVLLMFGKSIIGFALKEGSLVIYTLLALLLYLQRKYKITFSYFLNLNIALLLTFVLYLSFRLFLYLKSYTIEEALRAASYLRYYASFAIVFAFVIATYIKMIFEQLPHKKTKDFNKLIIILTIIFFSTICSNLYKRPPHYLNNDRQLTSSIAQDLSIIKQKDKNTKIMTIYNNLTFFHCVQITYELSPHNPYSELLSCVEQTAHFWPDSYKLDENFTIDFDMFNDKSSNKKNPEKYDVLYITSLDDNSERIIAKALGLKEVKDKAFIKINGKFTPYKTEKLISSP